MDMTLPVRKKNRKEGFDYSSAGWYFVTICTNDRIHYFGNIQDGIINYTTIGKYAKEFRLKVPLIYGSSVDIDTFVIMPNHIHAIIVLHKNAPSISTIIKSYKQQVTKKAHEEYLSFSRQKSFHDHIIRDQVAYERIQLYIEKNPEKWAEDMFYTEI